MTEISEPSEAPPPWDVFVLAECARLGPFSQAHLAPAITGATLGVAFHANLPLQPGELIVATIDGVQSGLSCPIVLTTRRLYWFHVSEPERGSGDRRKQVQCEGVEYRSTTGPIEVHPTDRGVVLIVGDGRAVPLSEGRPALAAALAETVGAVARAARSGGAPPVETLDPALVRRIVEVHPKVVETNRRLRGHGEDLQTFRRDVTTATPTAFVTPTVIAACLGVFGLMVVRGVNPMSPTVAELLAWGANDAGLVVLGREYWRLPASVFLHGGLIHLAVNMWCLMNIGPLVERLFGNLGYAVLYLAAGVGGAVASMAVPPDRVSVGASGAIFGVIGALLAFLTLRRRSVPGSVLAPLRSSALSFVVFNTLFGAVVPMIDQAAHMGGLATGFLVGLILAPPWPSRPSPARTIRTAARSLLAVALLAAVAAAAVHWRAPTLGPRAKIGDYGRRFDPARRQFLETAREFSKIGPLLERARADDDADARLELVKLTARLKERGEANMPLIDRIEARDPTLDEARRLLETAQREQLAALDALERFEKTGDEAQLEGPDGFVGRAVASLDRERECRDLVLRYLRDNGLTRAEPDDADDPEP